MRSPALATEPRAIDLADEAATAALGAAIAPALRPGDAIFLRGALGAGKTVLARAVIRVLLGQPEAQVPSPSYTLVNLYESPAGPVWHVDLYRLAGSADELEELGLDEAYETAILLVEWPERMGAAAPDRRLEIALSTHSESARRAIVTAHGPGWDLVRAALTETRL